MRQRTRADLGLALTMLDSDRLRQWAEKLDTYGSDISHWADRRFVIEQLQAVAGRIEDTVREVGRLRESAGIDPDAKDAIPPGPEGAPVSGHARVAIAEICGALSDIEREIVDMPRDEELTILNSIEAVRRSLRTLADASPVKEERDPIASAVRAELQPLEDALIDAGHKLAKEQDRG
jgi:hypothetical protein